MIWLAALAALAASATQITVGSYNIRVKTPDDTGVHSWDERKDYVARTVTDNGFDVVGFNEVKFGPQASDLISSLPQYDFYHFDGQALVDAGESTAGDFIAYRRDKFEILDCGGYFLCRNENEWQCDWDNSSYNNIRHTSWVKLKVKGTGEIFYMFCTHLDHQGNIARMLQAHINYEKAWQIAGHYPAVFVGDQNSSTSRVNYLRLFNAGFTDAFTTVEDPVAKFGSDDPGTAGQWADNPSGRRIDYIWARGFNVDSYDHCTNKYDLGAMPSDHIAIMAQLTFVDPQLDNRYRYVAPGGSGDGSIDAPFGSIQEAVTSAGLGDTIYVAAGDYEVTKQIDVTQTVRIFGGYDETFSRVVGMSNVKASGTVRCFGLKSMTDVEMRNLGMYNGNPAGSSQDGGAINAHGSRLILRDCVIADNTASRDGGGIDCTGQLIMQRVQFLRNKAGRYGGGFCCDNPNKRYWFNFPVEECLFDGNEAVDGSAAYLPRFVFCHISGNTFVNNNATDGSTLYLQAISSAATSQLLDDLTVVNNTFALNRSAGEAHGSAVYVNIDSDAQFALTNNTIVSNTSADGSAAVYMQQGAPCIANNIIAGNTGGDVFLNVSKGVVAAYNVYTSKDAVSYSTNARDIVSADMNEAVAGLARVLDGTVEDGVFIPNVAAPEAEENAGPEESADYSAARVPSIAVINPAWDESRTLCMLGQLRLREDVVKGDFNFDCMKEGSVYLTADQAGVARPRDGKATVGAREYVAPAAIDNVWADEAGSIDDSDAPVEYFDLQGRRVANPAAGLYLRRQGSHVGKIIVK